MSRDHIDLSKYYKREERGIDSVINIATNSSSDDNRDKAESIASMPENKFHSIEHTPELIPRRRKGKIRSTKVLSEKY